MRALVPLVVALTLTSCQPREDVATESRDLDTAAVAASIDSLGAIVMRANETGDAELFASTWARGGVMSAAGSEPIRGRDSIVAAFRNRPPLPAGASMTIHPQEIQVLSDEWAYVLGVDSLKHAPDGETGPAVETSTFLVLLRRTEEGWQTYREVFVPHRMPRVP